MVRVLVRWSTALVLAAAAGLIGWRVLAPAEVLDPATTPYPVAAARDPGVTGRTNVAPLIVDGRIRVYASERQVRADGPVDAKSVNTARWSLRRWPQQVSGVVASGATVISRWSDGEVVAVDGRTGRIVWRATGRPAPAYAGHRTGAATVWDPPGLHVTAGEVVVNDGRSVIGYDVGTGARRWTATAPPGCADGFTTAGGQYVCADLVLAAGRPVTAGWPAGPYAPVACDVARSRCAGLRDAAGHSWLTGGATPRRAPALDAADSTVVGGRVVTHAGGQVLGASGGRLIVLTPERHLRVVDPATGVAVADFPLAVGTEKLTWKPGGWQVADGWVAIERLAADGPADPGAPGHYFAVDPVIIAAV